MKLKAIKLKTIKYSCPDGHIHLPELLFGKISLQPTAQHNSKVNGQQNGEHYQAEPNLLSMRAFGKGFVSF